MLYTATRVGTHELTVVIRKVTTGWNNRAHLFDWAKAPDEILKKADRQTTSRTEL